MDHRLPKMAILDKFLPPGDRYAALMLYGMVVGEPTFLNTEKPGRS